MFWPCNEYFSLSYKFLNAGGLAYAIKIIINDT